MGWPTGCCMTVRVRGVRLMPTSPTTPPWSPERTYRIERDPFAKVVAYGMDDNVPNSFKLWSKDGKILTFGATTDSLLKAYRLRANWDLDEPSLVQGGG